MKRLGTHRITTESSSPTVVVVLYYASTNLPASVWTQEAASDILRVKIGPELYYYCSPVLDDVVIDSVRPQSGGGLMRITAQLSFKANTATGSPLIDAPIEPRFYYGGNNFDDFYFAIYSIDRTNLDKDITTGAMYGIFKVDSDVTWSEKDGQQSIDLIDILLTQDQFVGAKDEAIPDMFFIFNAWYDSDFIPKAYGQVPRVRTLNSFPSFSIKNFSGGVNGRVLSTYTNVSTSIVLEENVDKSSMLLQTAQLGAKVRVRMLDNEVIYGGLTYDSMAQTITLNVITRNTYYNQVQAYNDSLDGRTPNQWGPNPNWTDVRFSPYQTIIPNAKNTVLDVNGYMQADIWFYRPIEAAKGEVIADVSVKMNGFLNQNSDVVVHEFWEDPDYPGKMAQGSVSGFYNNTSNDTYLPATHNPLWPIEAFRYLKFSATTVPVKLFFNDPATSTPGSGSVGDAWQLVSIENATADTSCYIRNGFSKFETTRVYVEGEGKLIQVPPGNVTITQSGTFYGLTNMAKIALTAAPLDMNIGAKSNVVYVDCLYKTDTVFDNRTEAVLNQIIQQEAPALANFANYYITGDAPGYVPDNFLPYIGWVCREQTTATEIIDRICYQAGITLKWDYAKFGIEITGRVYNNVRTVTVAAVDYTQPIAFSTDEDEMLELSAEISIGKLKTAKYSTGYYEYIPLYYIATYGGWEDPFYPTVRSQTNRNVKPNERIVQYHFDLINDQTSAEFAITSSLSSCHPSGYCLAQRKIVTELSMEGCQWEPMCPIVVKNFPGISIPGNTNIVYFEDGNIGWGKESAADRPYIVGAFCNVESVTYNFDIERPNVKLVARAAQYFVQASGVHIYKPPSGVPLTPTVPVDPNSPPGTTNPGGGGTWTVVGTDYVMPIKISPIPSIEIDSTDVFESAFTITVDSGFIYNLGFSYTAYVFDPTAPGGKANLAVYGAELTGDVTGSFPDKINDAYVPPVKNLTLRVNYKWFRLSSLGTTTRELEVRVERRYKISKAGAATETDVRGESTTISRAGLPDVEGS